MSRRALVALLFGVLAGGAVAASTPITRGRGHAEAQQATDRLLGRTAASAPIDFTLGLRLPGQRRLSRFLRDVNDPSSPQYRHYIDAARFGERFGLPRRVLERARERLERLGIRVTHSYPQRTTLDARATPAALRRVFRVTLLEYRDRLGHQFHAPASEPVVPRQLAAAIDGVAGLNSRPLPARRDSPVVAGFKPADFARAYDFERLWRLGHRGAGQTIAVFSLYRFQDGDVDQFDKAIGTSKPGVCSATVTKGCVEHVPVHGGTTETSEEDELDVETIHGIAPDATVLNYETPYADVPPSAKLSDAGHAFVSSVIAGVNQVVSDGRAKVLSISYGLADHPSVGVITADDLRAGDKALAAALAAGVNTFVASGDQGAFECQRIKADNHHLCVGWPDESSSVISVGGTLLDIRSGGGYLDEVGWQDTLSGWGGGGGLSQTVKRPAWQSSSVPGVRNRFSNGMRQTPDVGASGSQASGTFIVWNGNETIVGGTSASAPFWAGVTALIAQRAQARHTGKLPYLNPLLYRLAKSSEPNLFHDVVRGGNRYYPATPGWDFATGLGSPHAYNLARAIIASLKRR